MDHNWKIVGVDLSEDYPRRAELVGYINAGLLDTPWASTVAPAAPATPQPSPRTNQRSSPMLRTVDTARKASGATELPTERSRQAK